MILAQHIFTLIQLLKKAKAQRNGSDITPTSTTVHHQNGHRINKELFQKEIDVFRFRNY